MHGTGYSATEPPVIFLLFRVDYFSYCYRCILNNFLGFRLFRYTGPLVILTQMNLISRSRIPIDMDVFLATRGATFLRI